MVQELKQNDTLEGLAEATTTVLVSIGACLIGQAVRAAGLVLIPKICGFVALAAIPYFILQGIEWEKINRI